LAIQMRLKELRKKRGYTQVSMAAALGVNYGSYRNWEQGVNQPDNYDIEKIIDLLNTTADYLYGRTNNPERSVSYSDPDKAWLMDKIEKSGKVELSQIRRVWEAFYEEQKRPNINVFR